MGQAGPVARPATMTDVARALGVSVSTVSNAYNRPDQLSAERRRAVLDTARRLGYVGPDPRAASLRRGRSAAVGLVFTERLSFAFAEPSATAFLQGLTAVLEAEGLSLLLLPGVVDEQPERDSHPLARAVSTAAVDAFVVYSVAVADPAGRAARERGLPTVVVDGPAPVDVTVDDRGGSRAAVEHLLGLGHRHLAVLSFRVAPDGYRGPVDVRRRDRTDFTVSAERFAGIRDALAAAPTGTTSWAQLPIHEVAGHVDDDAARVAARRLLDAHPEVTGVLCTGDFLALAVLDVAGELGFDVPGGLSVVGFDDVPLAAPRGLTTVHQPAVEKGRSTGELLLRRLVGTDQAGDDPVVLPTELVVRSSTGPAPEQGRPRGGRTAARPGPRQGRRPRVARDPAGRRP